MKTKTVFLAMAIAVIAWLTATGPAFSHGIRKPQHPSCYKGLTLDREQKAQIHERFMEEFNSKKQLKECRAERGFLPDMITSNSYSEGDNRQINTYDTQGKPLSTLYKRKTNNVWQDSVLETYTYDGSGRPITYISQMQANGAWLNSEKFLFTYDGSGNIATNVYQLWSNGSWLNFYQDIFTYDASGKIGRAHV